MDLSHEWGVDLSVMRDAHFVVSHMLMLCTIGGAVMVAHDAHLGRAFYARDMYGVMHT